MTTMDSVLREIERVPESVLREVLDFVRFLKARLAQERFDAAAASEPVLAKDWNRPEEDQAWSAL
jgi:hypothetical protein